MVIENILRDNRRIRRVRSNELESNAVVAGPPLVNFNEPLPDTHPPAEERETATSPAVSNGDTRYSPIMNGEIEATLSVVPSRENLQSILSQFGLETPNNRTCHLASSQTSCCRHNISIESLNLCTKVALPNHCCAHQVNNRRGVAKRSCSFLQY